MQTLALARERLQARLAHPATPAPVRLAHDLVREGRGRYLPVVSSILAQAILQRGYDAHTLERVYTNRADGELGPVGIVADRMVQDLPTHEALRERLEAIAGELRAALVMAARRTEPPAPLRLLTVPCGLGAELTALADRLRKGRGEVLARLHCVGLDEDRDGTLLAETRRRVRGAGLATALVTVPALRSREIATAAAGHAPYAAIACPGLTQRLPEAELTTLLQELAGLLLPGGTLVIDRWEPSEAPGLAEALGYRWRCQSPMAFREMLATAGLDVEREHPSGEGGCVVTVARRPE